MVGAGARASCRLARCRVADAATQHHPPHTCPHTPHSLTTCAWRRPHALPTPPPGLACFGLRAAHSGNRRRGGPRQRRRGMPCMAWHQALATGQTAGWITQPQADLTFTTHVIIHMVYTCIYILRLPRLCVRHTHHTHRCCCSYTPPLHLPHTTPHRACLSLLHQSRMTSIIGGRECSVDVTCWRNSRGERLNSGRCCQYRRAR